MSAIRGIAILGATGSVGATTLDVLQRHATRYRVEVLTAHTRADALLELCRKHAPAANCASAQMRWSKQPQGRSAAP